MRKLWIMASAVAGWLSMQSISQAQVVLVTARFDTNRIAVGQSTMFRVFAEITPAYKHSALQIFSWYLDVAHSSGASVQADFKSLQKPNSDQDPLSSSKGVISKQSCLGIYDTFIKRDDAGMAGPVELLNFTVQGMTPGKAVIEANPGTGVASVTTDFLVAPKSGWDPLTGADYRSAKASITVEQTNSAPGSLDAEFNTVQGLDNTVNAVVLQEDGCLLVGGNFTKYGAISRKSIARLKSDGSLDTGFNPGIGANGPINAIAVRRDGKMVVGGDFKYYHGIPRCRIARLNYDGSLDTNFNPGLGLNASVTSLLLDSFDRVLVGGDFSSANGLSRNTLVRLGSDGVVDMSFKAQLALSGTVKDLLLLPSGKILVAGRFQREGETAFHGLMRLNEDGRWDTAFVNTNAANNTVNSIALQSDGKIVMGGNFNYLGQQSKGYIARLNPDGSIDGTFKPTPGANMYVNGVVVDALDRILIVGDFQRYNNVTRNYSARLNPDGGLDSTWDAGVGPNRGIAEILLQPDGMIVMGGTFTTWNGANCQRMARLYSSPRTDARESTIIVQPMDTSVPVGGSVSLHVVAKGASPIQYQWFHEDKLLAAGTNSVLTLGGATLADGGVYRVQISNPLSKIMSSDVRISVLLPPEAPGGLDATFSAALPSAVEAMLLQGDGRLLVGGNFNDPASGVAGRIARLNPNGTRDSGFNPGAGANDSVLAIAQQPEGLIYIGGRFTHYNGAPRNKLARLHFNGSLDLAFNSGSGFDDSIAALALDSRNRLLVGGDFNVACGMPRPGLVRLDNSGQLDASFDSQLTTSSRVNVVVPLPNGKILVGGWFQQLGESSPVGLARLNGDGSWDSAFNYSFKPNNTVNAIALLGDGRFAVAGNFNYLGNLSCHYIAILKSDGSVDTAFNNEWGPDMYVYDIAIRPDGRIILAGDFNNVNGIPSGGIAQMTLDGGVDFSFSASANRGPRRILLQPDGKILFSGPFATINDQSAKFAARVNGEPIAMDNTLLIESPLLDQTAVIGRDAFLSIVARGSTPLSYQWFFNNVALSGQTNSVLSLFKLQSTNAGQYSVTVFNSQGQTQVSSLRLSTETGPPQPGSLDAAFNTTLAFNNSVRAIQMNPDGKILLGGAFTSFGATPRGRVARLNRNGGLDLSFDPTPNGADKEVDALLTEGNGSILVGGQFSMVNASPHSRLARLSPTGSVDAQWTDGVDGSVFALAFHTNGCILAGGDFAKLDSGQPTAALARFNPHSVADPWQPPIFGAGSSIRAIAVLTNGSILLGGWFSTGTNKTPMGFQMLQPDGQVDPGFNIQAQPNNVVNAIALAADGKFILVGNFNYMGSTPCHYVTRLNPDGTRDASFDSSYGPNMYVSAVAVDANDKIILGGAFSSINGIPRSNFARLHPDGAVDLEFEPGSGPDNNVYSLLIEPSGQIVIGGSFTRYNGAMCQRIARVNGDNASTIVENPPKIIPKHSGRNLVISWTLTDSSYVIESTSSLLVPSWAPVAVEIVQTNGAYQVIIPAQNKQEYFRLRK